MNWISWLVGKSDKGIVDQVADGIDKFVYSGEEKAENQAKWESEVTKRWQADSEAPITRLTRPFLVIFTTIVIFVFGALDASLEGFSISQQYLDLFTITWTVMITAYFGGRSFEKGIVRKK